MDFQLVSQTGAEAGKIYPVRVGETSIGRERSNDLIVEDVEVSRKHAVLKFDGEVCTLLDTGSTNGTFVNGIRLSAAIPLRGGELITFGETARFLFERAGVVLADVPAGPVEPVENFDILAAEFEEPEAEAPLDEPVVREPAAEYIGQIPEFTAPPKKKRVSIWVILAILAVLVICCAITVIVVDMTKSWCSLAGWFFNAIDPGACP